MIHFKSSKISYNITAYCIATVIFLTSCLYSFLNNQGVSYAAIVDIPLNGPLPQITSILNNKKTDLSLLKGIEINPENPRELKFFIDCMNRKKAGEKEIDRLIKYFLGFLAVPEEKLWVNLSPYEKDRVISEELGQLDIGNDFLIEDYLLKQLAGAVTNPRSATGKKYWQEVFKVRGTASQNGQTVNKIWIVPKKAVVVEDGNRVFVKEASLKVMMEEDYFAKQNNQSIVDSRQSSVKEKNKDQKTTTSDQRLLQDIFRQQILPLIEKQVNESEAFAPLRQMYYCLILVQYFKGRLRKHVLYQDYIDHGRTSSIQCKEPGKIKGKIYEAYVKSFRQGIYNQIKDEGHGNAKVRRHYFSGGVDYRVLDVEKGAKGKKHIFSGSRTEEIKVVFFEGDNKEGIIEMYMRKGKGKMIPARLTTQKGRESTAIRLRQQDLSGFKAGIAAEMGESFQEQIDVFLKQMPVYTYTSKGSVPAYFVGEDRKCIALRQDEFERCKKHPLLLLLRIGQMLVETQQISLQVHFTNSRLVMGLARLLKWFGMRSVVESLKAQLIIVDKTQSWPGINLKGEGLLLAFESKNNPGVFLEKYIGRLKDVTENFEKQPVVDQANDPLARVHEAKRYFGVLQSRGSGNYGYIMDGLNKQEAALKRKRAKKQRIDENAGGLRNIITAEILCAAMCFILSACDSNDDGKGTVKKINEPMAIEKNKNSFEKSASIKRDDDIVPDTPEIKALRTELESILNPASSLVWELREETKKEAADKKFELLSQRFLSLVEKDKNKNYKRIFRKILKSESAYPKYAIVDLLGYTIKKPACSTEYLIDAVDLLAVVLEKDQRGGTDTWLVAKTLQCFSDITYTGKVSEDIITKVIYPRIEQDRNGWPFFVALKETWFPFFEKANMSEQAVLNYFRPFFFTDGFDQSTARLMIWNFLMNMTYQKKISETKCLEICLEIIEKKTYSRELMPQLLRYFNQAIVLKKIPENKRMSYVKMVLDGDGKDVRDMAWGFLWDLTKRSCVSVPESITLCQEFLEKDSDGVFVGPVLNFCRELILNNLCSEENIRDHILFLLAQKYPRWAFFPEPWDYFYKLETAGKLSEQTQRNLIFPLFRGESAQSEYVWGFYKKLSAENKLPDLFICQELLPLLASKDEIIVNRAKAFFIYLTDESQLPLNLLSAAEQRGMPFFDVQYVKYLFDLSRLTVGRDLRLYFYSLAGDVPRNMFYSDETEGERDYRRYQIDFVPDRVFQFWQKIQDYSVADQWSIVQISADILLRFQCPLTQDYLLKVLPFAIQLNQQFNVKKIIGLNKPSTFILHKSNSRSIVDFINTITQSPATVVNGADFWSDDDFEKEIKKALDALTADSLLWLGGHGDRFRLAFRGTPAWFGKDDDPLRINLYVNDVIARLLNIARGNKGDLSQMVIFLDACASGQFGHTFLNKLNEAYRKKEITGFPIVVTASEQKKMGLLNVLSTGFMNSVDSRVAEITGKHILNARIKAMHVAKNLYGGEAVFFNIFFPYQFSKDDLIQLYKTLGIEEPKNFSLPAVQEKISLMDFSGEVCDESLTVGRAILKDLEKNNYISVVDTDGVNPQIIIKPDFLKLADSSQLKISDEFYEYRYGIFNFLEECLTFLLDPSVPVYNVFNGKKAEEIIPQNGPRSLEPKKNMRYAMKEIGDEDEEGPSEERARLMAQHVNEEIRDVDGDRIKAKFIELDDNHMAAKINAYHFQEYDTYGNPACFVIVLRKSLSVRVKNEGCYHEWREDYWKKRLQKEWREEKGELSDDDVHEISLIAHKLAADDQREKFGKNNFSAYLEQQVLVLVKDRDGAKKIERLIAENEEKREAHYQLIEKYYDKERAGRKRDYERKFHEALKEVYARMQQGREVNEQMIKEILTKHGGIYFGQKEFVQIEETNKNTLLFSSSSPAGKVCNGFDYTITGQQTIPVQSLGL